VKNRLKVYGLSAEDVKVGDAENIPYPNNSFDLVYSWGVIHHTPNTIKALEEIIRVTKIGGEIKIMIYNRHSLYSFYRYLYHGLFKGRPFRTISSILYHHLESLGTKAYTLAEVKKILARYPVEVKSLTANVTNYDLLWNRNTFLRTAAQVLAGIYGLHRCGWFLTFELKKISEIKNKLGE
ncbi:MAG: class I SAM-dependent methyltransferase, partial [Blastocatellia bacterium]|nr:class I SAM-dependent methyltransferase [Blastocatellia bacterium]